MAEIFSIEDEIKQHPELKIKKTRYKKPLLKELETFVESHTAKKVYTCPHCSGHVVMSDDVLVASESSESPEDKVIVSDETMSLVKNWIERLTM